MAYFNRFQDQSCVLLIDGMTDCKTAEQLRCNRVTLHRFECTNGVPLAKHMPTLMPLTLMSEIFALRSFKTGLNASLEMFRYEFLELWSI